MGISLSQRIGNTLYISLGDCLIVCFWVECSILLQQISIRIVCCETNIFNQCSPRESGLSISLPPYSAKPRRRIVTHLWRYGIHKYICGIPWICASTDSMYHHKHVCLSGCLDTKVRCNIYVYIFIGFTLRCFTYKLVLHIYIYMYPDSVQYWPINVNSLKRI